MPRFPVAMLMRRFAASWRQAGLLPTLVLTRDYVLHRFRTAAPAVNTRPDGPEYLQPIWQTLAQQGAFHVSSAPALLSRRRTIALIGDLNLPQCRKYRVEQLAAFWRARDVGFEYAHFDDTPRATRILQTATHLMEYRLQSTPQTQMLRYETHRLRLPVLYDLDDPLFSISAYEGYGNLKALPLSMKQHFLNAAPSYLHMMSGADFLTASTPALVSHMRVYSRQSIALRRNFADVETLEAGRRAIAERPEPDGVFRVAFASGSQGHEADLATIMPVLRTFILGAENRRLLVLGHFDVAQLPQELKHRVETAAFTDYPGYLRALARADCAVMPLTDDLFNSCKSGVRVLDAAAVGVASVVADVGDLCAVVRQHETGFVAHKPSDWADALVALADPACARQMGQAARADLEAYWQGSDAPHIIDPEICAWVAG